MTLSERLEIAEILTLERDFDVYRRASGGNPSTVWPCHEPRRQTLQPLSNSEFRRADQGAKDDMMR